MKDVSPKVQAGPESFWDPRIIFNVWGWGG